MSEHKLKRKPKELILLKQLIDGCKLDEADQLIRIFEEEGGHTLYDIVLWHLLKCELLLWRGLYEDVVKLAEQTHKESLGLGKNLLSVDILLIMAEALSRLFQRDKSHDIIRQGEKLLKSLTQELPAEYKQREAYIAFLKGWEYSQKRDVDQAIKHFELSLSLREELGVKKEIAFSLEGIAWVFMIGKHDFDLALKYSERGMTIAEESGNKYCIGYCLFIMGWGHIFKGELDRSIMLGERALTIFNDLNNKFMAARILNQLGSSYSMRGELDHGIMLNKRSLTVFNDLNDKLYMAKVFNNLSDEYKQRGELDRALECIEQAIAINREFGKRTLRSLVNNHDFLIQILIDRGDLERARTSLHDLEQLNSQLKEKHVNLMFLFNKALILKTSLRARDRVKAEEILMQLLEDENLSYESRYSTLINICELLLTELRMTNDLDVLEELNQFIDQLLEIAEKSHSYWLLGETYLLQAKLALLSLNLQGARRLLTQGQQIAERYGLKLLAIKISSEHDDLLKQLNMWENLNESTSSLKERMEFSRLDEQMKSMVNKRVSQTSEVASEEPVLLLITSEAGKPIFSKVFKKDFSFQDHLWGGFLTAFNSFSDEMLSEGLDRAKFGEYILIMKAASPFLFCYLFKGHSYLAQNTIQSFITKIKSKETIWETFNKFYQKNQEVQLKDIPSLEELLTETFISPTLLESHE